MLKMIISLDSTDQVLKKIYSSYLTKTFSFRFNHQNLKFRCI